MNDFIAFANSLFLFTKVIVDISVKERILINVSKHEGVIMKLSITDNQFYHIWQQAEAAGNEAVAKLKVVPMSVVSGNNSYFVSDGVCGFAWVIVKPGTSKFARWLKKTGKARTDSYYGGVCIWISDFNQSEQKKYAFASAMAKVFSEAGFTAYAMSRLD